MAVLLAGEGPTELGDWAKIGPYRPRAGEPFEVGVLEALVDRMAPHLEVRDGTIWKRIRKYKAGDHRRAEARNVLGLAQLADEGNFSTVVFTRDRDRDEDRERDLGRGLEEARARYPNLSIVGGMAVEEIEAWILALLGERDSEGNADAKGALADRHGITSRSRMIEVIADANLDEVPEDAASFRRWRDQLLVLANRGS